MIHYRQLFKPRFYKGCNTLLCIALVFTEPPRTQGIAKEGQGGILNNLSASESDEPMSSPRFVALGSMTLYKLCNLTEL